MIYKALFFNEKRLSSVIFRYFCPVITNLQMKKIVRTVWIGLLSGLAFLSAGCSHRTTSNLESPKVNAELNEMNAQLDAIEAQINEKKAPFNEQRKAELMQRRESLQNTLKRREGSCIYGSPEVMQKYGEETQRLQNELNEVNAELDKLNGKKE